MDDETGAPAPSTPFSLFTTDEARERSGIRVDYGDFWFLVARAGGGNKRYTRLLMDRLRPHRRAIQTETIADGLAQRLSIETFAEGCVLGWGSKAHGDGIMAGKDGEAIPFSTEAAVAMLTSLPELFQDLKVQADLVANFRDAAKERDAKNS